MIIDACRVALSVPIDIRFAKTGWKYCSCRTRESDTELAFSTYSPTPQAKDEAQFRAW